jgi:ketosteroid isomerase-like protein
MSDDADLQLLREVYAEWARGNYSRTDVFDPEIEFIADYPERGTYHGLEGLRQGWQAWLSAWDDFTTTAERFIPASENTYVVYVHLSGRGKESGVPIEMDAANLVRVADRKIVHLRLVINRQEALEAAGLE